MSPFGPPGTIIPYDYIPGAFATALRFATINPVMPAGYLGFESDTDRIKIGDGVSDWNTLPYVTFAPSSHASNYPLKLSARCHDLFCKNGETNPGYQLIQTCKELWLQNSSYIDKVFRSTSVTIDITSSGINGLDAGSEAASTWYYIWAIGKEDGTFAALLSASSVSPVMPSGYTYKLLTGAVFNDDIGDFYNFKQINERVAMGVQILGGGTSITSEQISQEDINKAYPPRIAVKLTIGVDVYNNSDIIPGVPGSGYAFIATVPVATWPSHPLGMISIAGPTRGEYDDFSLCQDILLDISGEDTNQFLYYLITSYSFPRPPVELWLTVVVWELE